MTTAIVGRTGSGKTYAAKGIVERFLIAGERVCIIDPTGAWWGLRAPGIGAAFDVVILGGDHCDVPLLPSSGEALADMIASGAIRNSVVDISAMSGGERTHFLTGFLERLFAKNRHPLHLAMDEADVMAPQNPMPDQRRMQGAVNQIVRRGRIKGFRPMMITQRPAVLDKSVLSQIDTLIAMRLTSPQDRKAIEAWVKGSADEDQARPVLDSLAGLPRGEGWFWAPGDDMLERRVFPQIRSHDSSRTPGLGEADVSVSAPPAGLAEIIAALVPPADPSGEKKGRGARQASAEELTAADKRGYDRGYDRGYAEGLERGERWARAALAKASSHLSEAMRVISLETISESGSPPSEPALITPTRRIEPDGRAAVAKSAARPQPAARESAAGTLNSAARKMLVVLDTNPPVRRSWTQVATLAGLKARGGHFNAGRKALIDGGLIVESNGLVAIASPSAGAPRAHIDTAALVETWAGALSGAAPKILRLLFANPIVRDRAEVARRLGMQPRGGHWNAGWKELRDNEIVTLDGEKVTLSPIFVDAALRERG